VMNIVREVRGGRDNDPDFFSRMKPKGVWANLIRTRFRLATRRLAMNSEKFDLDCSQFRKPAIGGQLSLL
jgi:hypothetical protein